MFFDDSLQKRLAEATTAKTGATVFDYRVQRPGQNGISEFDTDANIRSIGERLMDPKSNYALTGCNFTIN